MADDKTWYGDDVDKVLEKVGKETDLFDDVPGVDVPDTNEELARILRDQGDDSVLADVVDGELESLLLDEVEEDLPLDAHHSVLGTLAGLDPTVTHIAENPQYGFKGAPREPNDHSDAVGPLDTPEGVIGIDPFADLDD